MIRTLCRGTALYDDRRRTNLHHVGDSSKIQNELGKTVKDYKGGCEKIIKGYKGINFYVILFFSNNHNFIRFESINAVFDPRF